MWEGWEAGIMAFNAFHTLSFPWPAFRSAMLDKPYAATQRNAPHPPQDTYRDRLSMSPLAMCRRPSLQSLLRRWYRMGSHRKALSI
jgi:hypothetical protein